MILWTGWKRRVMTTFGPKDPRHLNSGFRYRMHVEFGMEYLDMFGIHTENFWNYLIFFFFLF